MLISKPTQSGFIERFNGLIGRELLDAYLFDALEQVREMSWLWRIDYNEEQPHESPGNIPPAEYRISLDAENGCASRKL